MNLAIKQAFNSAVTGNTTSENVEMYNNPAWQAISLLFQPYKIDFKWSGHGWGSLITRSILYESIP